MVAGRSFALLPCLAFSLRFASCFLQGPLLSEDDDDDGCLVQRSTFSSLLFRSTSILLLDFEIGMVGWILRFRAKRAVALPPLVLL